MGNANTARCGVVSAAARIRGQTISYHSGVRTAVARLPAFGVRVRTVGDFFRGGQFIGKAAAGVPGKTSNEEIKGLLRAYPVMIHYA
jgi:hypothetical protein